MKKFMVSGLFCALAIPSMAMAGSNLAVSPSILSMGAETVVAVRVAEHSFSDRVTVDAGAGIETVSVQRLTDDVVLARLRVSGDVKEGERSLKVSDEGVMYEGDSVLHIQDLERSDVEQTGSNVLVNPGFEAGNMSGWSQNYWSAVTDAVHSGTYAAYDVRGDCIYQTFSDDVDSNTVENFSFWMRQIDDYGIAQVGLYLQNGGVQIGVAYSNPGDAYGLEDHTSLVKPNDYVTGIHVCGFSGGDSSADETWLDDFELSGDADSGGCTVPTGVAPSSVAPLMLAGLVGLRLRRRR